MRDLLSCLSDYIIEIGDESHRVRQPTLREALYVLNALESIEETGFAGIAEACRGWLPEALMDVYFGPVAYPAGTLLDLRSLLTVGVRDKARHDRDEREVQEQVSRRSWFAVLADYSDALNVSPIDALRTPFAFFVGMAAEVYRLGQRRKADYMIGYAVARTGDKAFGRILEQAGYTTPKTPLETPEWAKPDSEFVKAQKEKAKAWRLSQTKGEA